ncbi:hydrogenase expression/formation protein HypD [Elusimicrobium posterum]|uniref:hydrogenase formation protein HypD n=1 Tax=Elusimicrobium posterum TaxID=3116653 RepID=UPI003C71285C
MKEKQINIMEVCGTHTNAIAAYGIKNLLAENVNLISGPGCPVCVSADEDIETVIKLAQQPGVIICTFADMLRVPSPVGSLEEAKAQGKAEVKIIYSPLDAVKTAKENPQKKVILIATGFETTAPLAAVCVKEAAKLKLNNFFVFPILKLITPAIDALLSEENKIDAFLLPGNVSIVLGLKPYEFIASKYKKPGVIGGFEQEDILKAIDRILELIKSGENKIENAYPVVKKEGNPQALQILYSVFEPYAAPWRGLGKIENSGLRLKKEFENFDALKYFKITPPQAAVKKNPCRCADVLKGKIKPQQCKMFGKKCGPLTPLGPCMVSTEGACQAAYKYEK